ncbi:glycosyltransferase family 2 protein [Nocardioides mangrovicus]|uniref:Glycosyltransferase family 2 protein n=1 Tax=Nocardioides mangrovicus TaxID=2478913 RepID=A0A3L8NYM2_9ACTN|nr:glycosyltransferase family 2 protein [Nocardioides mangrovicus]RLV47871.1 glycosyltransferase family 2 protein [Nocardioides mangrovicus]
MSAPVVSVVVPSYRNAPYIEETVRSVLDQAYPDLELVVADHASDDGTWERLQQFRGDPRVRLLRTPAGGGAERNWNAATDAARGTYVKLLCGDDLIAPDALAAQVAALEEHPTAGVAACSRDLVDVVGEVLLHGRGLGRMSGLVPGPLAIREIVRAGSNLLGEPGCVLLRADALRKIGGWDARYPYLIDQFTYLRVLEHVDLVALPRPQASFRISTTQWSVRLATEQARQARAVHRHFRADLPQTVSAADEVLGSLRALRTAWLRRAAYVVWRRRMRHAA